MQAITEEEKVHEDWYVEAKTMTVEALPEFVRKLTSDYGHDYGTICHAIAAAMTATMRAINSSPTGGITGFQADGIKWLVLQHAFHLEGPARLVEFDWLLYPQYADRFTSIPKETWQWVRERAQERLSTLSEYAHPDVRAHMEGIAEHGVIPFGLTVAAEG